MSTTRGFWKYPDLRRLAEHAAKCFPDRAFFLCADEKLPSVTGAELYGLCKKAAAALDGFDKARHIALLGPSSAAWLAAFFAVLLDEKGQIRSLKIDERSEGSQGKRCDFACLETLCGEKLTGTDLAELGARVSSAPDVKCLHLFEILSACSSFFGTLKAQGLTDGAEQEYIAIRPERSGPFSCSTHEILGKRDEMQVRLEHRTPPKLNSENLAETLDAAVKVRYNGDDVISEELHASDFETVYAQLNRLFSKCHHREKAYFGLKGRVRFFNSPSMVGLFLLTISHSGVSGLFTRAWKIEKILHWLQTGYGKNPCKGFGG